MHTSERLYYKAWGLVFTEMHEDCFYTTKNLAEFCTNNHVIRDAHLPICTPLQLKMQKADASCNCKREHCLLDTVCCAASRCLNSFSFRNQDWPCDKRWSNHFSQMQHLEENNLMSRHTPVRKHVEMKGWGKQISASPCHPCAKYDTKHFWNVSPPASPTQFLPSPLLFWENKTTQILLASRSALLQQSTFFFRE